MAFDALAPEYDSHFTHSPTARLLRGRVQARMACLWTRGQRLLELGCGTGEDAAFLTARGIHVTATDASPAMLDAARRKNAATPADLLTFLPLDLHHLPDAPPFDAPFEGVLANFGVLNVVADYQALAAWLAPRVTPGGTLAFGVMPPWCAWEIVWHAAHGDRRTAARRLRGQAMFNALTIYYPRPRALIRAFAPHFQPLRVMPVGLFLPPSEIYPAIEKRPRLWRLLAALERRAAFSPLAPLADHYWIELKRV